MIIIIITALIGIHILQRIIYNWYSGKRQQHIVPAEGIPHGENVMPRAS